MNHTRTHSFKRNSPEEEYEKDNIGVDGSNVDYNGIFCDAFDDAKVDLELVKKWVANSRPFFFFKSYMLSDKFSTNSTKIRIFWKSCYRLREVQEK